MWDVHCHALTSSEFADDRDAVLGAAVEAGVTDIVAVSEDEKDGEALVRYMAHAHAVLPRVHVCVGLHPWRASEAALPGMLSLIRRVHAAGLLCAIGEIGLDFQPRILVEKASKDVQLAVFRAQAALAGELRVPVNVHSTGAGHYALRVLQELGVAAVVMHAFDGRIQYAMAAVAAAPHWCFSIPPCIVRSPSLQKLAARLPLENVLLESDAPALGPEKGGRNVPANICVARDVIAQLRGLTSADIARITTDNARRLFCAS